MKSSVSAHKNEPIRKCIQIHFRRILAEIISIFIKGYWCVWKNLIQPKIFTLWLPRIYSSMYIMDGPIYSKVELLDSNDNPIFLFPINSEASPMVPTIEILNFIGNNWTVFSPNKSCITITPNLAWKVWLILQMRTRMIFD